MNRTVRVRFAPSPTGGLHLGGVRTALYNYLFARQQGGQFILRIEDTDRTRFVAGAEEYIQECLKWCGIEPDESPAHGGEFGPYHQSERKHLYHGYAERLVKEGLAYYAFDTPQELEEMRSRFKTAENPSPQYNHFIRQHMRNSLTLPEKDVQRLLDEGMPHVIRIKMGGEETIRLHDLIRGEVSFNSHTIDDKVLLKADGMPTYHLAVVVDDHLMQITHVFRGEEWLPSAPVHVLLWRYLFGEENMPEWAHLPLILKPEGNGKLSKRDGERLGFPVFAMDWKDPATGEFTTGFKERGFLPEAFINMLAVLGWNDGSGQELFTLDELVQRFSIEKIHKAGAKFSFDKAKWFNHEWIRQLPAAALKTGVRKVLESRLNDVGPASAEKKIASSIYDDAYLTRVIELVKERCVLLNDFYEQAGFFFQAPDAPDMSAVKPKWNEAKQLFFSELLRNMETSVVWDVETLEHNFKEIAAVNQLKPGELMLPFRIMLVGGKFGPGVFEIAALLGKTATLQRISWGLSLLKNGS